MPSDPLRKNTSQCEERELTGIEHHSYVSWQRYPQPCLALTVLGGGLFSEQIT
ncbi:MAG: hypothetical protein FD153_920 [Rhodospirillaceae bacterium]|nr:MAG: hypothetical protein FD153_920 [Rhodospirillaceae bacterium]